MSLAFQSGIQYSIYHGSEGGHYDWHVDQGPLVTRRKLSLTLQLTDLPPIRAAIFGSWLVPAVKARPLNAAC